MKQQQAKAAGEGASTAAKKVTAAQLRVQKDLTELSLPPTMHTHFADPEDIMNFQVFLQPDEGFYVGAHITFEFAINLNFPHEPPKVKCLNKIYHPNIDLQGNVCLNILREDWKPVLSLNSVMIGLQYLFLEPNAGDPLNKEAAMDLQKSRATFAAHVKNSMRGGYVGPEKFDDVLRR
ncbi:NEDD8-conjugating enzyme UBC12 [Nadsonia fulvescens var. elongata DSM 6958]|uniref:NEDD8-conjugating enzyme UBC12 n=1 Tax=Nadsonia fulvescens var. elongata DSM 6958 TaxID=857566 RepID=A0A1E3PDG5_9ASCO|nr:NEDD8-conjugating enzyme UBC12 [Nadsonia fulvescens var. elongata DSM 6958]